MGYWNGGSLTQTMVIIVLCLFWHSDSKVPPHYSQHLRKGLSGNGANLVILQWSAWGGRVIMPGERFALGGLVCRRKLCICSKKWVGREIKLSSNHQQLSAFLLSVHEKAPSCMWQSSCFRCWTHLWFDNLLRTCCVITRAVYNS